MEPTLNDIKELRNKFNLKVSDEHKDFHPKDIARVNSDDKWLKRFLLHHDLDIKDAQNMLIETCQWRKNNKVNDIAESIVNMNYLNDGSVFLHNRDKDGRSLLIFTYRKNVKGQKDIEELKKVVIYWMERVERLDKGEPITVFFDMQDSGLSNLDMEYIQFIVSLFNLYYPNFLNYILIFDMPWVLNAAFKIIKTWLPAKAVQRIKNVDKKSLKDYVESSQALKSWGGHDTYEFVFVPESPTEAGRGDENKKKVHFANGVHSLEPTVNGYGDSKRDDQTSFSRLSFNPGDAICFIQDGNDFTGALSIKNISDTNVIYKVKTTSPEKFGVRPCCGILSPSASASINVMLLSGYTSTNILRDKFLVMCYPLENHEAQTNGNADLNKLWKAQTDPKKLEEHRLKCRVPSIQPIIHGGSSGTALSTLTSTSDLEQKLTQLLIGMNHLNECNMKLQNDLKGLWRLIMIIMFLVILFGAAILIFLHSPEEGFCRVPESPLKHN